MTVDHSPPEELDAWLGRTSTVHDEITAFPLNALAATLDRDDAPAVAGTPVPPLWHWLYFLPTYRPHQIRHDGHAHGGEFMPPIPLPRRVWAGSRFTWDTDNPLRVGDRAKRTSRIDAIMPKSGKTGELVFVKVIHEYHNGAGLSFTNEHHSAFRGAARPDAPTSDPIAAASDAAWHREWVPDPVLLFRYSALMFNSHRIHYDWPYATREEGYPTLLVQGPLIATLLMDLLRRNAPHAAVRSLEFKAVHPSFVDRALRLRGQPDGEKVRLWASDNEDRLTMTASADISPEPRG
jgi:3-methylfumaryl-CoA hydratase